MNTYEKFLENQENKAYWLIKDRSKNKSMTQHYNIEIIKTNNFFKVTYVNGKFKKIEHIKGVLDRVVLDSLGKIIPQKEKDIPDFNKAWFSRVNYTIILKNTQQTILSRCTDAWFDFYKTNQSDLSPKHTGADVNALKQIISYLKSQTTSENEVFDSWQMILDNWENLTDFHRKQMDLKYINSKLNVIIKQISEKSGTVTTSSNSSISL